MVTLHFSKILNFNQIKKTYIRSIKFKHIYIFFVFRIYQNIHVFYFKKKLFKLKPKPKSFNIKSFLLLKNFLKNLVNLN